MNYCSNCGTNVEGMKFCPNCGKSVNEIESTQHDGLGMLIQDAAAEKEPELEDTTEQNKNSYYGKSVNEIESTQHDGAEMLIQNVAAEKEPGLEDTTKQNKNSHWGRTGLIVIIVAFIVMLIIIGTVESEDVSNKPVPLPEEFANMDVTTISMKEVAVHYPVRIQVPDAEIIIQSTAMSDMVPIANKGGFFNLRIEYTVHTTTDEIIGIGGNFTRFIDVVYYDKNGNSLGTGLTMELPCSDGQTYIGIWEQVIPIEANSMVLKGLDLGVL